jgi:2-succinyl-6-hydroxy-2,4-cyclohexadiene-1-carboxylate synthase
MSLPNLIFLHGFLGAKEDWTQVCEALNPFANCVTLDLPITANYLQELHDKIKAFSSPILVGYSMGGRIALQLALHHGYEHLILLCAHPGIHDEAERRARLEKDNVWIEKLRTLPFRAFLEEWYAQPLFNSLKNNLPLLQQIIQKRSNQDPERIAKMLKQLSPARMPACHCFPKDTLFLYGEKDEKFKALSQTLPAHVRVRGIEDCGHILHLEDPATCAKYILEELS